MKRKPRKYVNLDNDQILNSKSFNTTFIPIFFKNAKIFKFMKKL